MVVVGVGGIIVGGDLLPGGPVAPPGRQARRCPSRQGARHLEYGKREGVKKLDYLRDMSPKSDPPLSPLREQKFVFFFNISLENVLRQRVTIQKNCFHKKVFQGMLNIFNILSDFFSSRGHVPKKVGFFFALPKGSRFKDIFFK